MRVVRANEMGFCFGVRDALAVAREQSAPADVTIHGELVHNEAVLDELAERGFHIAPEGSRGGAHGTPDVLITAHGVSDRERARLAKNHGRLIDTTCPLVARAHAAARALADDGYHVIVIGKPGHVEVRGLVGDLANFDVVSRPGLAARYPYPKLGVVSQTTMCEDTAAEIVDEIELLNPDAEIRVVDTICAPTKQRIRAVRELAAIADAIVVVGGKNSNNTRQLARICRDLGVPAHHVQTPDDLDPAQLAGCDVVGLTAGTSTIDATIDAVEARLEEIAAAQRRAS